MTGLLQGEDCCLRVSLPSQPVLSIPEQKWPAKKYYFVEGVRVADFAIQRTRAEDKKRMTGTAAPPVLKIRKAKKRQIKMRRASAPFLLSTRTVTMRRVARTDEAKSETRL